MTENTNNITNEEKLKILIGKIVELENRIQELENRNVNKDEKSNDSMDWINELNLNDEQESALKMMVALGMEKSDIKEMVLQSVK